MLISPFPLHILTLLLPRLSTSSIAVAECHVSGYNVLNTPSIEVLGSSIATQIGLKIRAFLSKAVRQATAVFFAPVAQVGEILGTSRSLRLLCRSLSQRFVYAVYGV